MNIRVMVVRKLESKCSLQIFVFIIYVRTHVSMCYTPLISILILKTFSFIILNIVIYSFYNQKSFHNLFFYLRNKFQKSDLRN